MKYQNWLSRFSVISMQIHINAKASEQVRKGFPWVYKSDIFKNSALEISEKGEFATILDNKGKLLATAYLNYNSTISARILTNKLNEKIDEDFFVKRIQNAINKRQKYFSDNYKFSRLIFSEADHLPGFIVDSYGDYLSCEINTAGADKLKSPFISALQNLLKPKAILISTKKDEIENLTDKKEIIGTLPDVIKITENETIYLVNLKEGQKTGWFYDQRANRKFLAAHTIDKNFLDLFCHSGGFGILAAKSGAKYVEMVDSSELALELARESAKLNSVQNKCNFIKSDAFDYLKNAKQENKIFDVISADPPAFIKSKKYIESGMKGYSKLVSGYLELFSNKEKDEKIFALTSCSHHADRRALKKTIENCLKEKFNNSDISGFNTKCKLITDTSADKDHLPHPQLAKTDYLKFFVYKA